MKKNTERCLLAFLAAALCLSGCAASGGTAGEDREPFVQEVAPVYFAGDDVAFDIRPQDDFYGYVNAETLWNTSVPFDGFTAGTVDEVNDRVNERVKQIVLETAQSAEPFAKGSDEQIIRDFYNLCMNGQFTDRAVFDDVFALIDGASDVQEMLGVLGRLYTDYGVNTFFAPEVMIDPFDPARYTLALKAAESSGTSLKDLHEDDDAATGFRDSVADTMEGYGADRETARKRAEKVVYLWLDIAYKTNYAIQSEAGRLDMEACCNRYTVQELDALLTNLDAGALLRSLGFSDDAVSRMDYLYIFDPEQLKAADGIFTGENLDAIKDYAREAFLMSYTAFLPGAYNSGHETKAVMDDRSVINWMTVFCPGSLSNLYMDRYYTPELDAYMHRLQDDIRAAYAQMIRDTQWLSESGSQAMVEKFNNITFYLGGDTHREQDGDMADAIGGSFLETAIRIRQLQKRREAGKLFAAPDHSDWSQSGSAGAMEVNAYYLPRANSIYIAAGFVTEPLMDVNADYYENLGSIGFTICHELSHAFDNNGMNYDVHGVYDPSWVSQADRDAFRKIVSAAAAHYDRYALLDVYHVNGKHTAAENLADLGAMECVLRLAQTGEAREKVFTSYAKTMAALYQNTNILRDLRDNHSPNPVRVNAVLSCFPEFYEVYDVSEGCGMYIAPENRVTRW